MGLLGNSETSPPLPLESLSSMPMPGVAGAGVEGVTRAGLLADLLFGATDAAGALCAVAVAGAMRATVGATAAGATVTVRCDTVAPRSTQRSGSSGHPDPANAEPADVTHAAITAMTRNG